MTKKYLQDKVNTKNLNAYFNIYSIIYIYFNTWCKNDSNAIILFNVFLNISIILIIIAVIYPFRKKNNFDIQKKTTKQNIKRHNFN